MLKLPWHDTPLTKEEADNLFMLFFEDDTEDAPWMTMGDLQYWSASSFAHSLRNYAREHGLPWYVAGMLPITYTWGASPRKKVISPDTFVAFVPDRPRSSFDVEEEGVFPPFVLEVVSPSSVERDEREKREAYDLLKVQEYALFTPREAGESRLAGYRRDAAGAFAPWPPDAQGRLWSEVLGLYLVARGPLLQAQTRDGRFLLTPDQSAAELRRAEEGRRREAEARRRAEEEVERLRRELERYRRDG
jgi:Uma2 family endonuclease